MSKNHSKAGAIYLIGIGLFLCLIGGVFMWLMAKSFRNASDTREWVEIPCLIIQSEVEKRSDENIAPEFRWNVAFKYQFEGSDYISELYRPQDRARGQRWGKSIEKVKKKIEEYPKDSESVCFVNPAKPSEAILDHDTKAAGYSIWFPGLFCLGGVGIIIGAVRSMFKAPKVN